MSTTLRHVRALSLQKQQRTALRALLTTRSIRNVVLLLGFVLSLICFYALIPRSFAHLEPVAADQVIEEIFKEGQEVPVGNARFHLLVPATSSSLDLCKLSLSAQILDYPTPVLINFGHPEDPDGYVQHLAKPQGILDYLDSISGADGQGLVDEDLVLIVDGYDVWMQLRRDVLISRYYEINNAADARTKALYGDETFRSQDMRQAIIFGPDKICWPIDFSRPACWAVPRAALPEHAFGPRTDHGSEEFNLPRWLNSGTILGPASDLRRLFQATIAEIQRNHTTDSDQFYLAELFGRQEFARLQHRPDLLDEMRKMRYPGEEDLYDDELDRKTSTSFIAGSDSEERTTEFHIGIDYESRIFQTLAFYKQFLTWTRASSAWRSRTTSHPSLQYDVQLAGDILRSPPPMLTTNHTDGNGDLARPSNFAPISSSPWQDVDLLYNTATAQHPVLLHIAGGPREKPFREYWWSKLWFHASASQLRLQAVARHGGRQMDAPTLLSGGYRWRNAVGSAEAQELPARGYGGAWVDHAAGWLSWKGLCGRFEEEVYRAPSGGQDFFHPREGDASG
ncbi:hypothetical protein LTR78_006247 [Recurvomyces mirabilis]|uniref:Uncharacterized protein n=1 Tax=Recurvomyces mirabilis TaxID=574656 RepID=A0AAE0WLN8_9PEZI|nr:hypothetical protein LTR78_006247 [Recurvomyces mirabilis]KAK5152088.1 hypothetical protein LTS14_008863 [Recurvomyces mirabilis]